MVLAAERQGVPVGPVPSGRRLADRTGQLAGPLAAVLTAALVWFGTGLHAIPELTWLAALPMLAVAPALAAHSVRVWAFLGWVAGAANLVPYAVNELDLPLVLVAVLIGLPAVLFT